MDWTHEFEKVLPLLGHRNWILVVDKAYPYQSAPGITTIDTQMPLPIALEKVVAAIKAFHACEADLLHGQGTRVHF